MNAPLYYTVKAPIKGVLVSFMVLFLLEHGWGGGNFCRYQTSTRNFCIARGHPYNPPHYYLAAADRDDNKRENRLLSI